MGNSFQEQTKGIGGAVKICALIPCHNNAATIGAVVEGLPTQVDILIVDDGSDIPVAAPDGRCKVLRFERNRGKACALRAGFERARADGYTHAVTLDADGQHPTSHFADFTEAARRNPSAIIVGVRDFSAPNIPEGRRFMNKFSNFWFRFETGIDLRDTQCGYRCYPLDRIMGLKISRAGFVYEAELLVRAAWAGIEIVGVKIPAIYTRESIEASHYRPFVDTAKFSAMNAQFSFMALVLPKKILKKFSLK